MSSENIGEFDFTNFIGCKMPQQELKTLVQIVRNLQGISPLSGVEKIDRVSKKIVLQLENSRKFYYKADLRILFSWVVDQGPNYFPDMADLLI